MKYFLPLFFLLLTINYQSFAEDFEFGKITDQEIQMKRYNKDTNAHAVVLNEYGKAYVSTGDHIRLQFEHHVKIKIFDSKAFNSEGNIVIRLDKEDSNIFETARDIEAITSYLDDDGILRQTSLDQSKIFHVNQNKYFDLVKFDMPNMRRGCVIEYKYKTESPFLFNFHTWDFQDDIPKMHSEYHASIPGVFDYNISLRGALKLTKNTSEIDRECFSYFGTKCDCSNLAFIMDDVPAFVREEYMTASKNFISAIYFEMSQRQDFNTGAKVKITKEWKDVDYSLKSNEYFGSQIKRSGLMKDRVKDVIAGKTDEMAKAKALYEFVQKSFKWNNFYGKYSDDGIRTALDKHTGNIGDINLTLIAALKASDINTEAVLLSTRDHGIVNRLFPVESDFDYVIAKVNIGEKSYLLDASDPLLGFGMLPLRCINDQGRVISFEKPSYWIDIKEPQKESSVSNLNLILQPNGKITGTFKEFSSGYAAYRKREEIKEFNSFDEYAEHLDERFPKVKILKSEIEGLDSLDNPIAETYEIEIDGYKSMQHDRLSFNPFIFGHLQVNPFKLADRTYPVDMGVPSDERFSMTLHLPDNFTVESASKDQGFSLPDNGGRLISNLSNDTESCTYSQALSFYKPVYSVDEYPSLKEFYNKVVQAEGSEIIFKKKQ
ncbi:transglutaminase domain-containing protein [Mucilaginibacter jinjuensis]|uniref:Transglutaminase domain-containing protein n=1 Tax=Mucilaginibacter jinjuensis TaxID=1176721 RepID=A0ABY7TE80_9SPHI|nr:transglutaminase domain-containing protein [Mucilaginibacter jinjuensis]WCT14672.1 transglutaminase domain-containing protein [Mucilaginibacter jinjuensis]